MGSGLTITGATSIAGALTLSAATGVVINANQAASSGQVVAPLQMSIGTSGGDYPYVGYNVKTTTTSGSYLYASADFASRIVFQAGGINFQTAASGASNGAITWATKIALAQGGSVVFTSAVGFNGNSAPVPPSGFGTPVGGAVVANYNITDAGGANSNTNKCVAEILTVLKALGFISP